VFFFYKLICFGQKLTSIHKTPYNECFCETKYTLRFILNNSDESFAGIVKLIFWLNLIFGKLELVVKSALLFYQLNL
jgi:hypothetical protein